MTLKSKNSKLIKKHNKDKKQINQKIYFQYM